MPHRSTVTFRNLIVSDVSGDEVVKAIANGLTRPAVDGESVEVSLPYLTSATVSMNLKTVTTLCRITLLRLSWFPCLINSRDPFRRYDMNSDRCRSSASKARRQWTRRETRRLVRLTLSISVLSSD